MGSNSNWQSESWVAASEIDTQRAARDAARARMDVIRAELSNRVITAPFDGVLGVRQVSVGSLVTPGTPIATLDDLTTIKLDFSVPERFLATITEGQQVSARSDTYPERTFSAQVSHIDARVDPVTRSVALIAEIPNADRTLRPGMLMSVTLYGPQRQALVLPEIAVVQVGLDSFVFRVKPDGTAERVKVGLGSRSQRQSRSCRGPHERRSCRHRRGSQNDGRRTCERNRYGRRATRNLICGFAGPSAFAPGLGRR